MIFTVTTKLNNLLLIFQGPGVRNFFARSDRECGPINIFIILTLGRAVWAIASPSRRMRGDRPL